MIDCPVCGEPVDEFDICENCNWHNSGSKESDDGPMGPNKIPLGYAKHIYRKKYEENQKNNK